MNFAGLSRLAETIFDTVTGNGVIASISRRRSRNQLRILAYHGVDDKEGFRSQMEHLCRFYEPVSADQVLDSLKPDSLGGRALPPLAVWVTLDDGHPSVVDLGLPITERLGIPITLFVCPAVIDTNDPYWWQAIAKVSATGPEADAVVRQLKQHSDTERREAVRGLVQKAVRAGGKPPTHRQLTSQSLQLLAATKATIGNHTWDHPTLDTCEPFEQEAQIRRAHDYLRANEAFRPVIAYPNGNWTPEAEAVAEKLGYQVGLLFDHRLTDTSAPRFRWSRLRVGSDTSIRRFASILSGAHPRFHQRRESKRARARAAARG